MEKKQTVVEWLIEQLPLGIRMNLAENGIDLDQAKQLEKQQIVDAHKANAVVYEMDATTQAEQYFTETYGKDN